MKFGLCDPSRSPLRPLLAAPLDASAQATIQGTTSGTSNSGAATIGGLSFAGSTFGPVQLNSIGAVTNVYLGVLNLNRGANFNCSSDTLNALL